MTEECMEQARGEFSILAPYAWLNCSFDLIGSTVGQADRFPDCALYQGNAASIGTTGAKDVARTGFALWRQIALGERGHQVFEFGFEFEFNVTHDELPLGGNLQPEIGDYSCLFAFERSIWI